MHRFFANTQEQVEKMLQNINIESIDELFTCMPDDARLQEPFVLPEALSEYDAKKVMQDLAGKNISANDAVCFLGAGIYDHYVPAAVSQLTGRSEFSMGTTKPVQAGQGSLQAVYELQETLKRLFQLPYICVGAENGAEAMISAALLSSDCQKRNTVVVSKTVNPQYRSLLKGSCKAKGLNVIEAEYEDGRTVLDWSCCPKDEDIACVIVQSPNFFGIVEDMEALCGQSHEKGALFVAVADPISLSVLKTPGEYGADISVSEGQSLGNPFCFGGMQFGIFAAKEALAQFVPGNAVIMQDGQYCYEKKDRKLLRWKDGCALSAIAASIYIAIMGQQGLRKAAETSYSNACYTYGKLLMSSAFKPVFSAAFYREFVVKATKKNVNDINNRLLDYGMIGGYSLKKEYPELGNAWLVCVTEKRSADEIDLFIREATRSI